MTTFTAPAPQGTALTAVTPSAPAPDLRFKDDPLMWIKVPAGTAIAAFATGVIARSGGPSGGIPGNQASAWTLFQLEPLPQMNTDAFRRIPGGLPVQLVLLPGTAGPAPAAGDLLVAGAALATAPAAGAYMAFAFQDRLCRDPLTAAEAIAASGAAAESWTQFAIELAALPHARDVRVLDHVGRPAGQVSVTVAIDGNPPATVTPHDGDTGIPVPAASTATVAFASAADSVVAGEADTGAFGQPLRLAAGQRVAQLLDAADWLADNSTEQVQVKRWHADSLIEPIQEGTPYFTALVADLRAAKPGGKAQLAGWAFVKGSQDDDTVDWPLVPGDVSTTFLNLVHEARGAGVDLKMLVNHFLKFDSATLDDFPELVPLLFALYASLMPAQSLAKIQTDPAGYAMAFIAISALTGVLASSATFDLIKSKLEYSQPLMDALEAIDPALATWTPYAAAFADNPLVPHPPKVDLHTIDDISHVGVYHQKYVTIKRADGSYVAYLGGIDINNDRPDTTLHRAKKPFHDVQVRVTGPAIEDLVTSYQERAHLHGAQWPIDPADVAHLPAAGSHLVQIARTYFAPAPGSPTAPLPFAKQGETTPVRTIINAIRQARDFIYIEDQYFTPPDDYVHALHDAAATCSGPLFITMPYQTDQPYGGVRRADVLNALQGAWGGRLYTGTPLRRFMHEVPGLTTNLGRMRLATALTVAGAQCDLAPLSHIPPPPFWAFAGNELVLAVDWASPPSPGGSRAVQIIRATPGAWGAEPVSHPAGTPVLAVQIAPIYVHAKVMIVDDVFLFAGSSNINRRGLYHDGEIDSFTIPQHLKGDPRNPARLLRSWLMAEHAGLSAAMGEALFADPRSAIPYLTKRTWYQGAQRQPLSFFGSLPPSVSLGISDSIGGWVLANLAPVLEQAAQGEVWPLFADPTTSLDPSPAKGPHFP
jgi:phosphatidylserine/phosphatidylglycerophosphate/cardiolipin synthase-like enzyme